MEIRITGIQEALAALRKYAASAEVVGRVRWLVGSNLVYAFGIETGRHRSGRLARRAGGVFMLRNALARLGSQKQRLVAAIPQGASATESALAGMALFVEGEAKKAITPFPYSPATRRRTGHLRRSIHTLRASR